MPGFRMLAFNVWKGRVHSKTFESFLLSLQSPILNRIFGERRKLSKSFGVHPAFPHLEGKHSEPWHNILRVLFDTIMTPPQYVELVILCGDVIICMNAY